MVSESGGRVERIVTSRGDFEFRPVELFYGRKLIDKQTSKDNLLILNEVLGPRSIRFGLIYGTLLGAVREHDFIEWDEDVDVFLLDEQRQDFLDSLWDLRAKGLELVRVDGDLYSLMRLNDYIDVYVFRRVSGGRACNQDFVPHGYLDAAEKTISFCGSEFQIPSNVDSFLRYCYGIDWKTPKRNSPARPWAAKRHVKEWLKRRFPWMIEIKRRFLLPP